MKLKIKNSKIGLGVRLFANGPGDLGSIPGRVIPKTQKMVLDASLLSTQHYKVRIKGKVEQSRKGVAPSPTHWCSSYRKGSLRVTLDYGRQLYLLIYICTYIYIYIYIYVLNWTIIVGGNMKASFSIATTPRYRTKHYSFPWIASLTFDLYLIMLSVKQGIAKYNFWVFGMTQPRIESWSPMPLTKKLTIMPVGQCHWPSR